MSEVRQAEDPIQPFSLTGLWRSILSMMDIFRERPAPACAFILCLLSWAASLYRIFNPQWTEAELAGACLTRDVLFGLQAAEWRRFALHIFWPLEAGYVRGFFLSAAMIIQGYALEYEVGTPHFTAMLLGCHAVASATLLYFRLSICDVSLEPSLAALAIVIHRINPKVHTNGLDKAVRLPWAIEPRWHIWLIEVILLLSAGNFPRALAVHFSGYLAGALLMLREPDLLFDAWHSVKTGSERIGFAVHVTLLIFALFFMPVSAQEYPSDIIFALCDGRALRLAWWSEAVPASPPLLHMGLAGLAASEATYICKLMITMALPLLVSPLRLWLKFYAVGCVLLAMYCMNSNGWRFPHIGFVVIVYLAWAFWKLPSMQTVKRD
eukprot:TRINITY_DN74794_c0_g1_i1.p1 TRINITY_DN74794_c0_g1~~TRINITY_DN74794_c0_g1_i1.p1  ORF type:complete len:380 (-),score=52.38 TRINITY_DN74794_c0_g1_i1:148-1287(-)